MKREVRRHMRRFSAVPISNFDTLPGSATDLKVFDGSRRNVFYHSGDFGDIIYAMPTVKAMGGGNLVIGPEMKLGFEVTTRQKFTQAIFDVIAPLLAIQPYLNDVQFSASMPADVDVDLNRFRRYFIEEPELRRQGERKLNLAETHLWTFRQALTNCTKPWLIVDKSEVIPDRPVLIHRSARWRNNIFPWDKVLKAHGHHAAFIGLETEYAEFTEMWGHICRLPFVKTTNFLELARLIAGSKLFVGNQSAPYAIAEGLKKNTLQEVWPEGPNCLFPRENAYYGDGAEVYIPKLASTMTLEKVSCPFCGSKATQVERSLADIVKCLDCHITYLRTRPSKDSMEARYQTYADGTSHMRLPVTVEEIRTTGLRREYFMQELLTHLPDAGEAKGKLLDIGCGWGAFLANAREKGFEPVGVEICTKMANFANSVLGIKVYGQQLEDCTWTWGDMTAISIIHVLEHLPYQKTALETIHRLLKPNGIFCGIVPNYASFCSKALKDQWSWLDPEMHYVHFTPPTLRAVLEKYGFTVQSIYTHTGDFDLATIIEHVRLQNNLPMSSEEVATRIQALGSSGEGEEIRFFAKK